MVGKCISTVKDNRNRIVEIAVWGALMLLVGWLLQYGIPCSKKAWTSTYVLITCGMAACILAMLIYAIDIKGHNRWCRFFQAFGVNPLFCYLVGTILSIVFGALRLGTNAAGDTVSIHTLIHDAAKPSPGRPRLPHASMPSPLCSSPGALATSSTRKKYT